MNLLQFFKDNPGSQIRLARKLKVHQSYLSMIAHGHRIPSFQKALEIFIELEGTVPLKHINISLSKKIKRLWQSGLIQHALTNGE